ncbi:CoB--CoM heterodisulfide reductase iron-sulfur subunit B family protein [Candidatus Altiarchaeota archaeon]
MDEEYLYYPGCSLKNNSLNFEQSALAVARALGFELKEMDKWNCCGTVYSLAPDDLFHQIAPIRNLIQVQEKGREKVVTLCAMCYNTLKQANHLITSDQEKLKTINSFMDREQDYEGKVKVLHLLEVIRDELTFEGLKGKVKKNLGNLKVSPYYGCVLTRPEEVALDDVEEPRIMHHLLESLGAEVVDDPYKTECCGSYKTVDNPGTVIDRTYRIISSVRNNGAEAIALACPLCAFNLDYRQEETLKNFRDFAPLPVFYFTQLMGLAMEINEKELGLDKNFIDPRPMLRSKKIIQKEKHLQSKKKK